MLNIIKNLFTSKKDAAGYNVDQMINRLAAQYKTSIYSWSYIQEGKYYENTVDGKRVYSYEVSKYAA